MKSKEQHMQDLIHERRDYKSESGIARYWTKDGMWHIARLHTPTAEDRQKYPASYPEGSKGAYFKWTNEQYATRDEAIAALNGGTTS